MFVACSFTRKPLLNVHLHWNIFVPSCFLETACMSQYIYTFAFAISNLVYDLLGETPRNYVGRYEYFRGTYCVRHVPWRWRHFHPMKTHWLTHKVNVFVPVEAGSAIVKCQSISRNLRRTSSHWPAHANFPWKRGVTPWVCEASSFSPRCCSFKRRWGICGRGRSL